MAGLALVDCLRSSSSHHRLASKSQILSLAEASAIGDPAPPLRPMEDSLPRASNAKLHIHALFDRPSETPYAKMNAIMIRHALL